MVFAQLVWADEASTESSATVVDHRHLIGERRRRWKCLQKSKIRINFRRITSIEGDVQTF